MKNVASHKSIISGRSWFRLLLFAVFVFNTSFSIASTISLPQTGQTSCWDASGNLLGSCTGTGQDGEYRMGLAWPSPRFTVNSAAPDNGGTVTDNLTGLVWSKGVYPAGLANTWQGALDYIKSLNNSNYQGYNDWRLPNVNELRSLVNGQQANPAIWLNSQGYSNFQASYYWSASTCASSTDIAWLVNLGYGGVGCFGNKAYSIYHVWPVRGGQVGSLNTGLISKTGQSACYDTGGVTRSCSGTGEDGELQSGAAWPSPRFTVNSSSPDNGGTVTDTLTGLVWSKDANPASANKTWQQALDYITTLNSSNYQGYNDWRLPNREELASLVNYAQNSPATWLNGQGFANVQSGHYWSSSTGANLTTYAWYVGMYGGYVDYDGKSNGYYVWPVRGGQSGAFGNLVISKAGSGAGSVSASSGTISWFGTTGSATYATSTSVTLTATPDSGSSFSGWSGCDSVSGTSCTVTMSAARSVTASFSDTIAPVISTITLPTTSTSLTVTISSLTAIDAVAVTGYCLTETNSSSGCTWTATAPANYTFSTAGSKTLYAFARDAAGNISASASATTTITLPDTTAPVVSAFSLPATATSLTVTISSLTATDNVAVTGYCLAESNSSSGCAWTVTAPTSYTFSSAGSKTLYAFARDAAGNISASASSNVTLMQNFTIYSTVNGSAGGSISCTSPVIQGGTGTCTISSNLTTLTDNGSNVINQVVNGTYSIYQVVANHSLIASFSMITVIPTAGQGGSISPSAPIISNYNTTPLNFTITPDMGYQIASVTGCGGTLTENTYTTASITGNCTIVSTFSLINDTTPPVIGPFTVTAKSSSLTIPITAFTATDNIVVSGYLITESATKPAAGDNGWSNTVPASYVTTSSGKKTLYAWVKDASGNVSASAAQDVTVMVETKLAGGWTITDLGTLGGESSTAQGINNLGQIVGTTQTPDTQSHAVIWTNGLIKDLGLGVGVALNNAGDVVGYSYPSGYPAVWKNDVVTNIDTMLTSPPPGGYSVYGSGVYGINDSAQIIGWANFNVPGNLGSGYGTTNYILTNGTPVYGLLNSINYINNLGTVAGRHTYSQQVGGYPVYTTYAAIWENDIATDLPLAPGTTTNGAYWISHNGRYVVGFSTGASGGDTQRAALWENKSYVDLGTVKGTISSANAVNNSGQVVGWWSAANAKPIYGALWKEGVSVDLNDLVTGTGWSITEAKAINDSGQIVGNGTINGLYHAFLLTPDITLPVVSDFSMPSQSSSLNIVIFTLSATDNVAVTGYCLAETNSSSGCTWTATAPISYTFSTAGSKTLYAFTKDAAGNISASASATTTITLPDTTAPVISAFSLPATATSLMVTISSLTASDAVGVTGYCLSETNSSSGCTWNTTKPTSYTFSTAGSKTLYAFTKDAAGNISASASATTTITLPDTTLPVISAFSVPSTVYNRTVVITTLSATDNVGITGYCLVETASSSGCSWLATKPGNYAFATAGSGKMLYAFVKDAAGNISTASSAAVSVIATGDVNGDGIVNITDVLKVMNSVVGKVTLSTAEKLQADVAPFVSAQPSPDGTINISDVVLLLERAVGIVSW